MPVPRRLIGTSVAVLILLVLAGGIYLRITGSEDAAEGGTNAPSGGENAPDVSANASFATDVPIPLDCEVGALPDAELRGYPNLAPDLAVEVLGHDDHPGEALEKVGQWLKAGVRLVWLVDAEKRTARSIGWTEARRCWA